MATKLMPGSELTEAGFGELQNVPFIIGDDGSYCAIQNRFLRERATNKWAPEDTTTTVGGELRRMTKRRRLRPLSINAFADALTNVTDWLEDERYHPGRSQLPTMKTMDQEDLVRYANDMESGSWSRDGQGLTRSTVTLRLATAIDCCEFAATRALRKPISFTMSYNSFLPKSHGRNAANGSRVVRPGYQLLEGRRPNPELHVTLPTQKQLGEFIGCFKDPTHQLGADFILNSGLRISELPAVLDNAIPTVEQARLRWGHLNVDVDFPIIGKGGKQRMTSIPGDLLEGIDQYRAGERLRRLNRHLISHAPPLSHGSLLVLSDGRPLSPSAFRKAWNQARKTMTERGHLLSGFSPHIGRHAFAVYWLLMRVTEDLAKIALLPRDVPQGALEHFAQSHLVVLQHKLGHGSFHTTEKYLVLLKDLAYYGQTVIARQDFLDEEADA